MALGPRKAIEGNRPDRSDAKKIKILIAVDLRSSEK